MKKAAKKKVAAKKRPHAALKPAPVGSKERFEQLLGDAIFGVKKK